VSSGRARPVDRVLKTGGPTGRLPWTGRDGIPVAGLIAVGGLLWFIGWWRLSGRSTMEAQIGPMNLAAIGVMVIGAGQVLWFLRGRRAVGTRRVFLLGHTAKRAALATAVGPAADRYVGVEQFFHRTDCAMAIGRAWPPITRSEHLSGGRIPCGVCAP
jgi:hypothetical protein